MPMANLFTPQKFILQSTVAALFFTASSLSAQVFFNNGAQIFTAPSAIIHINGGIENNSATANGNIDHNGIMTVTVNSTFPNQGDVRLQNNSVWQGDGRILLEGDWVNDATFQQDLSHVTLYASNNPQQISGTVSTTFHVLKLTGTGTGANRIKTQTVDASADSMLVLNDRELATDIFTFFVLNPDPSIVTNTIVPNQEGFVSSIAPGTLSRVTNSTSGYSFPTGSSRVLTRYRPVIITPTATASNTFTTRFVNYNADNDGFLRTINDGVQCLAIDTFYHAILRPVGNTPADIMLHYIPSSDGNWSGMAHWRTNNNMWNDMAITVPGNSGIFTTIERSNWLFANPGEPYLLTELKPAPPTVVCPAVCENGNGIFIVNGNGTVYTWTTPNGTVITNGQGTDTATVSWNNQSGYVYVNYTSLGGCPSLPDSCFITPMSAPIADFDTLTQGPFGNIITFLDSSTGATSWSWDFGDGSSSTSQNPNHQYNGGGNYTVTLYVTNAAGCTDTIQYTVRVNEGILIPNVFTPDGDGINDEFFIPSSGFESFAIEIYNRWGTKVWEANAGQIRWDGFSTSGQKMSDGTYYFVLKAFLKSQTGAKDYSTTGYISLLTKKK